MIAARWSEVELLAVMASFGGEWKGYFWKKTSLPREGFEAGRRQAGSYSALTAPSTCASESFASPNSRDVWGS